MRQACTLMHFVIPGEDGAPLDKKCPYSPDDAASLTVEKKGVRALWLIDQNKKWVNTKFFGRVHGRHQLETAPDIADIRY